MRACLSQRFDTADTGCAWVTVYVRARGENRTSDVGPFSFRALAAVCLSSGIQPKCVYVNTPPGTLEHRGVGDYRGTRIAVAAAAAAI